MITLKCLKRCPKLTLGCRNVSEDSGSDTTRKNDHSN